MTRLTEIVHFIDGKVSSKVTIDTSSPIITDKGFVKQGFFWLRPEISGESMKISIQEALLMIASLQQGVNRLLAEEYDLQNEAAEEYKRSKK